MSKKEDLISAFSNRTPEGRVPLWELEFHLWDKVSGRHLILGQEYLELSAMEKETALHQNAEIFMEVSELCNFSALTLPSQFWEIGSGHPAYYWMPEDGRLQQAKVLRKLAPQDLMLVANCSALLGIPMGEDYVKFAYLLKDSPQEVGALAEQKLQEGIQAAVRFREAGVEIGLSTTDLADNHGTFMSPRQLEMYVWPYLDLWVDALKDLGMISILHSDGNIRSCLERIANSGVNCLQAIDPTAGMDMISAKQQVGDRLCLAGNIDCDLLVQGSPRSVFEATKNLLLNCKESGGLILGASNAVQLEVPLENYMELVNAWKEVGGY
jgi:uroporphyrinogen decarboxylase